nr:unnamed protein product [Callosobruchus analis]
MLNTSLKSSTNGNSPEKILASSLEIPASSICIDPKILHEVVEKVFHKCLPILAESTADKLDSRIRTHIDNMDSVVRNADSHINSWVSEMEAIKVQLKNISAKLDRFSLIALKATEDLQKKMDDEKDEDNYSSVSSTKKTGSAKDKGKSKSTKLSVEEIEKLIQKSMKNILEKITDPTEEDKKVLKCVFSTKLDADNKKLKIQKLIKIKDLNLTTAIDLIESYQYDTAEKDKLDSYLLKRAFQIGREFKTGKRVLPKIQKNMDKTLCPKCNTSECQCEGGDTHSKTQEEQNLDTIVLIHQEEKEKQDDGVEDPSNIEEGSDISSDSDDDPQLDTILTETLTDLKVKTNEQLKEGIKSMLNTSLKSSTNGNSPEKILASSLEIPASSICIDPKILHEVVEKVFHKCLPTLAESTADKLDSRIRTHIDNMDSVVRNADSHINSWVSEMEAIKVQLKNISAKLDRFSLIALKATEDLQKKMDDEKDEDNYSSVSSTKKTGSAKDKGKSRSTKLSVEEIEKLIQKSMKNILEKITDPTEEDKKVLKCVFSTKLDADNKKLKIQKLIKIKDLNLTTAIDLIESYQYDTAEKDKLDSYLLKRAFQIGRELTGKRVLPKIQKNMDKTLCPKCNTSECQCEGGDTHSKTQEEQNLDTIVLIHQEEKEKQDDGVEDPSNIEEGSDISSDSDDDPQLDTILTETLTDLKVKTNEQLKEGIKSMLNTSLKSSTNGNSPEKILASSLEIPASSICIDPKILHEVVEKVFHKCLPTLAESTADKLDSRIRTHIDNMDSVVRNADSHINSWVSEMEAIKVQLKNISAKLDRFSLIALKATEDLQKKMDDEKDEDNYSSVSSTKKTGSAKDKGKSRSTKLSVEEIEKLIQKSMKNILEKITDPTEEDKKVLKCVFSTKLDADNKKLKIQKLIKIKDLNLTTAIDLIESYQYDTAEKDKLDSYLLKRAFQIGREFKTGKRVLPKIQKNMDKTLCPKCNTSECQCEGGDTHSKTQEEQNLDTIVLIHQEEKEKQDDGVEDPSNIEEGSDISSDSDDDPQLDTILTETLTDLKVKTNEQLKEGIKSMLNTSLKSSTNGNSPEKILASSLEIPASSICIDPKILHEVVEKVFHKCLPILAESTADKLDSRIRTHIDNMDSVVRNADSHINSWVSEMEAIKVQLKNISAKLDRFSLIALKATEDLQKKMDDEKDEDNYSSVSSTKKTGSAKDKGKSKSTKLSVEEIEKLIQKSMKNILEKITDPTEEDKKVLKCVFSTKLDADNKKLKIQKLIKIKDLNLTTAIDLIESYQYDTAEKVDNNLTFSWRNELPSGEVCDRKQNELSADTQTQVKAGRVMLISAQTQIRGREHFKVPVINDTGKDIVIERGQVLGVQIKRDNSVENKPASSSSESESSVMKRDLGNNANCHI